MSNGADALDRAERVVTRVHSQSRRRSIAAWLLVFLISVACLVESHLAADRTQSLLTQYHNQQIAAAKEQAKAAKEGSEVVQAVEQQLALLLVKTLGPNVHVSCTANAAGKVNCVETK